MSIRGKLPLGVLLIFFLIVFATLASGTRDPELEQCKHQCGKQRQYDEEQKEDCRKRCEKYYKEKHRREEEEEGERRRGDSGGYMNPEDPFKELRDCEAKCDPKEEHDRSECRRQCLKDFAEHFGGGGRGRENPREPEEQKFRQCRLECRRQSESREEQERCERQCEREHRERQRGGEGNKYEGGEEREELESEGQQQSEPYVFKDQHFSARLQTDHGKVRILQRFNERSELLRGIENYRVAILEANPHTFIVPNHWDAESILFVHQGRATISLVRQDKRESFNMQWGDVLRIPSGTTVYMVNRDNNEKLVIVKLIQPVFTPGHFEAFFGPGGENPESYFRAFSSELLEAAFNTRRDKFEKVFQQQRQGVIIKASEEQIRGMSHHEEGGIWPFGGESKGPFNLYKKHPSQSNQYGQFYEANPSECRDLRELDLGIAFANITRGSMMAPMYNSRATKIAIVVKGEGYLEISCPHVSSEARQPGTGGGGSRQQGGGGRSQQQGQSTPRYQKVSSDLRRGNVYVIPAGHPFITVASKNENLEVLCFDVKAIDNEKFTLAGRKNIFNQFEREAKELAFGVSAREVDEVFKSQDEEFFFRGPRQQHKGRAYA